jgi:hypothetical protein
MILAAFSNRCADELLQSIKKYLYVTAGNYLSNIIDHLVELHGHRQAAEKQVI